MWYSGNVLDAVLYVFVGCFVVRGCADTRRYIDVCNCDMFGVVSGCMLNGRPVARGECISSRASGTPVTTSPAGE